MQLAGVGPYGVLCVALYVVAIILMVVGSLWRDHVLYTSLGAIAAMTGFAVIVGALFSQVYTLRVLTTGVADAARLDVDQRDHPRAYATIGPAVAELRALQRAIGQLHEMLRVAMPYLREDVVCALREMYQEPEAGSGCNGGAAARRAVVDDPGASGFVVTMSPDNNFVAFTSPKTHPNPLCAPPPVTFSVPADLVLEPESLSEAMCIPGGADVLPTPVYDTDRHGESTPTPAGKARSLFIDVSGSPCGGSRGHSDILEESFPSLVNGHCVNFTPADDAVLHGDATSFDRAILSAAAAQLRRPETHEATRGRPDTRDSLLLRQEGVGAGTGGGRYTSRPGTRERPQSHHTVMSASDVMYERRRLGPRPVEYDGLSVVSTAPRPHLTTLGTTMDSERTASHNAARRITESQHGQLRRVSIAALAHAGERADPAKHHAPHIPSELAPKTSTALLGGPLRLGMCSRRVTVLSMSLDVDDLAASDPEETFWMCNALVCQVMDIVSAHAGEVTHLGLTEMMCAWNTQVPHTQHALMGCTAARGIQAQFTVAKDTTWDPLSASPTSRAGSGRLSSHFLCSSVSDSPDVWAVALATGNANFGTAGNGRSRARFLAGAVAQQAHAVRGACADTGCPLLVADSTRAMIYTTGMTLRPVDYIVGPQEREPVYQIAHDMDLTALTRWKQAFCAYFAGDHPTALHLFHAIQRDRPGDDPQLQRLVALLEGIVPHPLEAAGADAPATAAARQQRKLRTMSRTPADAAGAGARGLLRAGSNLRQEICEVLFSPTTERSSTPSDDASLTSKTSTNADLDGPPKVFTDRAGTCWRRSMQRIGRGAHGEVWLGMDDVGSFAAFKCMELRPRHQLRNLSFGQQHCRNGCDKEVESMINEVDMLSKYRHDSVVSIISCGVYDSYAIIAMEYVSGGSLAGVIEQFGALPTGTVRRYTRDILAGLVFLHGCGIVHLDLKPANILLHADGYCKLSDFGTSLRAARCLEGAQEALGTPLFMAPEVLRSEPATASDLWSLGLTVLQMITSCTPFAWDADVGAMPRVSFIRWLCREDGHVPLPAGLEVLAHAFVAKLLAWQPQNRPAAKDAVCDAFLLG